VDAHAGNGQVPEGLPTFADGARAAEICDAMLRSAASGEWVNLD
jgi:predicted dehydrogenase